ncbi:MAG: SufD family Fe-S cluster assembly protein [Treponema sp.]|nr:SufD family Fe-S cluster assembly protein [Treponema sp.]
MSNAVLNQTPALTWTWLKMNKAIISDDDILNSALSFENADYKVISKPDSVRIIKKDEFKTSLPVSLSAVFSKTSESGIQYKEVNEPDSVTFNENNTKILVLEASKKETVPVVINVNAKGKCVSEQIIHALPDSEITVILVTESKENDGVNLIRTKCYAEENAKIHLCKVQLLKNGFYHIDSTENVCGENAKITYTELQLGAASVITGAYTNLSEYKASYKSDTAYYRKGNQKIDMNYVCAHSPKGKKSECSMAVAGTLTDEAQKTYRGTIDFKRGCAGAKGNETEETLLLSPKAVNRSVPVILCDEEDVEGEHGATIGRLNDDMLFYMESHGISEEEACALMARAKINAVSAKIPDESIREKVENFLNS